MRDLIERCCGNDGEAWVELWSIIEEVAARPIQRVLGSWGLDLSLTGDILQELYLYLQEEGQRRLLAFRGTSQAEFKGFLHTIVVRFTLKIVQRWCRARQREHGAIHQARPAVRTGPTVEQFAVILDELCKGMTPPDQERLRRLLIHSNLVPEAILGGTAPEHLSERTARHWRREFKRKYSRRL